MGCRREERPRGPRPLRQASWEGAVRLAVHTAGAHSEGAERTAWAAAPMPFLGRRREPRGGGCPRAAVQVTSDPSSPPAPAGPVHHPPAQGTVGKGDPSPAGLGPLLSPGPSGLCYPGSSLATPTAHTAAVRGGDSLGLVVWLSFGWRGQPSSRRFCHAALPREARLLYPPAPLVLEGGPL